MNNFLIIVFISLLIFPSRIQSVQDSPHNYLQIILEPTQYNCGFKDGRSLIINRNEFNMKLALTALGTELLGNESLIWDFSIHLEFRVKQNNIPSFIDSIKIQVPGHNLNFSRKHFMQLFSLPSDTSKILYSSGHYDINIAFYEFEFFTKKDTLCALILMPEIVISDGKKIFDKQEIIFCGLIRRE